MIIGKTIEDFDILYFKKSRIKIHDDKIHEILEKIKDLQIGTAIYFNKRYIIINLDNTEEFLLK